MVRKEIKRLIDIPNVGKAVSLQLQLLGINEPGDLAGKDPYQMYSELCTITGKQQDPCLLDIFISAVNFMEGGPPKKWWKYTAKRKKKMAGK